MAVTPGNRSATAGGSYRKIPLILGSVGVLFAVAVLWINNPQDSAIFPPCPVHWATGLHCPGCGALRAIHRLLHGDLGGAMRFNPLLVISMPALLLLVVRPSWGQMIWVPRVAFAVLVGFGIVRNIPLWPFLLLAPGQ